MAIGKIGHRALVHVAVVKSLVLVLFKLPLLMEVLNALLQLILRPVTLKVVQLIVLLVNGNLGDRALQPVEAVKALALALS